MSSKEYLLDTHTWLWWLFEPERLSKTALDLMQKPENRLTLSVASIWEIGIKVARGKLKLPSRPMDFIPEVLAQFRFTTIEIQAIHALEAAALPPHHADPFDRLLIAQSHLERIPLVSADLKLDSYGVKRIW